MATQGRQVSSEDPPPSLPSHPYTYPRRPFLAHRLARRTLGSLVSLRCFVLLSHHLSIVRILRTLYTPRVCPRCLPTDHQWEEGAIRRHSIEPWDVAARLAVATIAAAVHRWAVRRRGWRLGSAHQLQGWWRGYNVRRGQARIVAAATTISAGQRGFSARVVVRDLREERRHEMAEVLQGWWPWARVRRHLSHRRTAAAVIGRLGRGGLARKLARRRRALEWMVVNQRSTVLEQVR